jgi:alpha-glucosidase
MGFPQVRWSYQNWSVLQEVIDGYANANIQLEGIWSDLDYLYMNRIFTNDPIAYPLAEGQEFLARLHANGQYWMPILDPQVYVPDPTNATDAFTTYDRGAALNAYIWNGDDGFYIGDMWPGLTTFVDFLVDQGREFWTNEFVRYHGLLPFDGWWVDLTDAASWCTGSCGNGQTELSPVHVPFPLQGDPGTRLEVDYRYPEGFEVTNATEAASASASLASLNARFPTDTPTLTPTVGRTLPTPGIRNLNFPPYTINNWLPGHSLVKNDVSSNATHSDEYNTTEYDLHNLYSHTNANATHQALLSVFPGKRPFLLERSTFAGTQAWGGHWLGDSNSNWENMYSTIGQALQMSIVGFSFVGPEPCGFNGNADLELCARWMELSAFFTLYRNHNNHNTIPQEAYRWATVAEATRRAMDMRFRLLLYTYTLNHRANKYGETVMRALQFEFPDEEGLKAVQTQFLLGPSILITPVLDPLMTSVQGVFPGVAVGEVWYDWYKLQKVNAGPGENVTLDAPLEHINVHLRGGTIIASQTPGNTTKTTRMNPWSLTVALDANGEAKGELYLDDDISLVSDTLYISVSAT